MEHAFAARLSELPAATQTLLLIAALNEEGALPEVLAAGTVLGGTEVSVEVPARAFAHWDGAWRYETGTFELHVGASVVDLAGSATLELE